MKKDRVVKLNALCRMAILLAIDFITLHLSNLGIIHYTMGGKLFNTEYIYIVFNFLHLMLFFAVSAIIFRLLDLYKSVWTFAGADETVRIVTASIFSSVALFLIDRVLFNKILGYNGILPYYAYFLMCILVFIGLCFPRKGYYIAKRLYRNNPFIYKKKLKSKRVMIVGAGFMGDFFINELIHNDYKKGYPVLAVDDDPAKLHKRINGVKVRGTCNDIPRLTKQYDIDIIMICLPSASKTRQKEIINLAMETGCKVKIAPSVNEFLESNNTKAKRIRNIEINDLLARPEVKLDKKVCRYLIGKTVLVTGGGGSIGAELCNQVARYSPETIVIFDIYENCAFELANELKDKYSDEI